MLCSDRIVGIARKLRQCSAFQTLHFVACLVVRFENSERLQKESFQSKMLKIEKHHLPLINSQSLYENQINLQLSFPLLKS